jgi:dTDP-4-amino-4,6-dideoxygalactose transaminase
MIRLTIPDVGCDELEAIREVLRSGMLVQGRCVAALEARLAERVGAAHAVACSSGTAALHLALLALGVGPGDEVIVPAFTYPASANVVVLCGARPVLADVRPDTFAVDPGQVEAKLSPATKAVMPVHPFGLSADMDALGALAERHRAAVVEDAACALGASCGRRPCGSMGRLGCFSFHPRKAITTAEGGAVTTDDAGLAERIRVLRNHGLVRREPWPDFVAAGFNYRMSDVHGAIGVVQLGKLDTIVAARRQIAAAYAEALGDLEWLALPAEPPGRPHIFQTYVTVVGGGRDRDGLVAHLREGGVESSIGTYALHLLGFYRRTFGYEPDDFPVARSLFERTLALPIYRGMTEADVDRVSGLLHDA